MTAEITSQDSVTLDDGYVITRSVLVPTTVFKGDPGPEFVLRTPADGQDGGIDVRVGDTILAFVKPSSVPGSWSLHQGRRSAWLIREGITYLAGEDPIASLPCASAPLLARPISQMPIEGEGDVFAGALPLGENAGWLLSNDRIFVEEPHAWGLTPQEVRDALVACGLDEHRDTSGGR